MKKSLFILLIACLAKTAFANGADRINLVLDWFINPDHAAIIVAQQQGFFKKYHLDVHIIEPTDPSLPPKLIATHQADIAIDYLTQLQMAVAQGLPLVRIASLFNQPLSSLVVLDDGHIKTLADLKGKKIGHAISGFESIVLKTMLNHAGLTLNDVEMVNVNYELSPALLSKRVDAINGAFRNFEVNQLKLAGVKAKAFFPEQNGVPNYEELVVICNKDQINAPKFQRFVAALDDATDYIKAHPQKAWQAFISYNPALLNTPLNQLAWQDTIPYISSKPSKLNRADYQNFSAFLYKNHVISHDLNVSDYTKDYAL